MRPAGTKCPQDPISTNGLAWWLMPVISVIWRSTNRRIMVQTFPGIKCDPISILNNAKRAGGLPQVVELLP
jgi:hypothetical protein